MFERTKKESQRRTRQGKGSQWKPELGEPLNNGFVLYTIKIHISSSQRIVNYDKRGNGRNDGHFIPDVLVDARADKYIDMFGSTSIEARE